MSVRAQLTSPHPTSGPRAGCAGGLLLTGGGHAAVTPELLDPTEFARDESRVLSNAHSRDVRVLGPCALSDPDATGVR